MGLGRNQSAKIYMVARLFLAPRIDWGRFGGLVGVLFFYFSPQTKDIRGSIHILLELLLDTL